MVHNRRAVKYGPINSQRFWVKKNLGRKYEKKKKKTYYEVS